MRTHHALHLVLVPALLLLGGQAIAATRPITDFTSRQGDYCLKFGGITGIDCTAGGYGKTSCDLFVPPQPNAYGWSAPKTSVFALVDYAGLADPFLGGRLGTA